MTEHQSDADPFALHPDCPDLQRLGPSLADSAFRAMDARRQADDEARDRAWSKGFTRRRLLAGAGAVGVAAIGSQLVTTRVSFAAPGAPTTGTVVVVFLRGGMDGLSVVVPAEDPFLLEERPGIVVRGDSLLPLDRGFGLHPALAPLHAYFGSGQLSAVPAISTPDLSRSHFQAQDSLERGASSTSAATSGWLDRVLEASGPGTTFRAIGHGSTLPRSLAGSQGALAMRGIGEFDLEGYDQVKDASLTALRGLYTGLDHPVAFSAIRTLDAVSTAQTVAAVDYVPENGAEYPDNGFARALQDLARLIKADVGLRVASVDLGGWDMHTGLGTVDDGDMRNLLTGMGGSLAAFATDLGDKLGTTTVVTMSEFGRRIEQNANAGTDHGHGGVALLLGGPVAGGTVHGNWEGLDPAVRDNGDVPGSNDYRNLLGDVVVRGLGISEAALPAIFPGHTYASLGTMK